MSNPFKKPKPQKIEIPKPDPIRMGGADQIALIKDAKEEEEARKKRLGGGRIETILTQNRGPAPRILGG